MTRPMPTIPPRPTSLSKPYWDACREGRLTMQACRDCGELAFYAVQICPACASSNLEWKTLRGTGKIHSLTEVHRPSAPVFAGSVPYIVALIQVTEGPIMMSNIVGPDAMQAKIGDDVEVVFEDLGDVVLPRFRRVRI